MGAPQDVHLEGCFGLRSCRSVQSRAGFGPICDHCSLLVWTPYVRIVGTLPDFCLLRVYNGPRSTASVLATSGRAIYRITGRTEWMPSTTLVCTEFSMLWKAVRTHNTAAVILWQVFYFYPSPMFRETPAAKLWLFLRGKTDRHKLFIKNFLRPVTY